MDKEKKIVIINIDTLGEVTEREPLELINFKFLLHAGNVLIFESPIEIKKNLDQ